MPELVNAQSLLRSHLKEVAVTCFAISQMKNDPQSSPEITHAAIAISKIFEDDPDVINQIKQTLKKCIA